MSANELYALAGREFSAGESKGDLKRVGAAIELFRRARTKGSPLAAYSLAMLELENNRYKQFLLVKYISMIPILS